LLLPAGRLGRGWDFSQIEVLYQFGRQCAKKVGLGKSGFLGLEMGFLGKFAHRGAQAARILKPPENGRAHFIDY